MLQPSTMQDQVEISETAGMASQAAGRFGIEEILRRAYQIHREHGGFFGYDFDDWAQAWSELPQTASQTKRELGGENGAELMPERKREVFEPCFGCGN